MLALIPASRPFLTPSGAELRACMSMGTCPGDMQKRDHSELLDVRQLRRCDGTTSDAVCTWLYDPTEPITIHASMADGSSRYTEDFHPLVKLFGPCREDIFGRFHELSCFLFDIEGMTVNAASAVPKEPIFVEDRVACQGHCISTLCQLTIDVIGQLPDFTVQARLQLAVYQRSGVMWRSLRLGDIRWMDPSLAKYFFRNLFFDAFHLEVGEGLWLPAQVAATNPNEPQDVMLRFGMTSENGTTEIQIWSQNPNLTIEPGMELWRVLHWKEHQQWDERGQHIDEAIPASSRWRLAVVKSVLNSEIAS